MEFSHRMRDILNVQEQQQQALPEATSPTTTPPPPTNNPSSSSSSTTTHWAPQQAAAGAAGAEHHQREHMFEKVVTPSDVGKLNRLVIPKQHAERYFPLDPAANDKGGLLLNFEEGPTGRHWRFRYSYWNSSQSYVMTKGWSRFVKDKRLGAGDTVSFSRSPSDPNRLFIDWRRRPVPLPPAVVPTCWGWSIRHPPPPPLYFRSVATGPVPMPQVMMRADDDDHDHDHGILDSVPVRAVPHVEPKRQMRLFGVNIEEEQPPPSPSPMQLRLSASTRGPLAPRRTGCSELQLMPTEEGRR